MASGPSLIQTITVIVIVFCIGGWITFGISMSFLADETLSADHRKNWEILRNVGLVDGIATAGGIYAIIRFT